MTMTGSLSCGPVCRRCVLADSLIGSDIASTSKGLWSRLSGLGLLAHGVIRAIELSVDARVSPISMAAHLFGSAANFMMLATD